MPELTTSTREAARRIGISETALRKAEGSNRIAREPNGQWDIDKIRRRLTETADPARSPLAAGGGAEGTPFARLKVAQLALKVEAQRLSLDETKRRLLDVTEANAALDEIGSTMRDALLNWPARVSGLIAAEMGAYSDETSRRFRALPHFVWRLARVTEATHLRLTYRNRWKSLSKRLLPLVPPGLSVERIVSSIDQVTIVTAVRAATAACPDCRQSSARIHAVYQRRLQDLPWQGRRAVLLVRARRFRCANLGCPRQTFAESLGPIAARSARRSARLAEVQCQLGLALGGEAGARLARRLTVPASADTLLRLVHRARAPAPVSPRVLAVDDWAWRRGQNYGSILVDLERNRVVDLLPDRETATLSAWLQRHGGVEIVARDRAGAYADGVRQGAPDALQVADRWHLLRNLGEALQAGVDRHRGAVHQAARAVSEQTAAPTEYMRPPAKREERTRVERRDRRQVRYEEMVRLHRLGLPGHAIGRVVGASMPTVYRWLKAGGPPTHTKPEQPRNIGPHEAYLTRRWAEGCRNGARLWRELHAQGYRGGMRSVVRWTTQRRREEGTAAGAAHRSMTWRVPSSRRCARLIGTPSGRLDAKERAFVDHLARAAPNLVQAGQLGIAFADLLRERRPDIPSAQATLAGWMDTARRGLLNGFVRGLERDQQAVAAAIATHWTTSPAEGQITRLKAIKRSMYGRAGFHLLRQRVLLAA